MEEREEFGGESSADQRLEGEEAALILPLEAGVAELAAHAIAAAALPPEAVALPALGPLLRPHAHQLLGPVREPALLVVVAIPQQRVRLAQLRLVLAGVGPRQGLAQLEGAV